jgi:hypothetical protein
VERQGMGQVGSKIQCQGKLKLIKRLIKQLIKQLIFLQLIQQLKDLQKRSQGLHFFICHQPD